MCDSFDFEKEYENMKFKHEEIRNLAKMIEHRFRNFNQDKIKTNNNEFEDKCLNFCNQFHFTFLGQVLHTLNEILMEVNYSRKQNCKLREFVLKPLNNTPAFLLIKPTNATNHIFYSVLTYKRFIRKNQNLERIFRNWITIGYNIETDDDIICTHFISTDVRRIAQHIYPEQKMLGIWSLWMQILSGNHFDECKFNEETIKHFSYSLLIFL